jgi:hypothetical protein
MPLDGEQRTGRRADADAGGWTDGEGGGGALEMLHGTPHDDKTNESPREVAGLGLGKKELDCLQLRICHIPPSG